MTYQDAQWKAAKLGLSAWVAQMVVAGEGEQVTETMCVGFRSADVVLAEGSTWRDALDEATRIIFSA
jgi:hypothetical protein